MKNYQIPKERRKAPGVRVSKNNGGKTGPQGPDIKFADMKYKLRPVSLNIMGKEYFKTDQAYLKKNQLEFPEMKNEIRSPTNS